MKSLVAACLLTISLLLAFPGPGQATDLALRLSSPDIGWDSLREEVRLSSELPSGWRLVVSGRERYAREQDYSELSEAFASRSWSLDDDKRSVSVGVGRAVPNWSLWGGDSVVFSSQAPGVDQLSYSYHQGKVAFDKVIGRLSGDDRYLLAQRLTMTSGPFTGSVGEVAVADGAFAANLATLVPWPYYLTQWIGLQDRTIDNDSVNDSAFVQVQYRLPRGVVLGGEFFADDMPGTGGNDQPWQVAGLVRGTVPIRQGQLALEYARVNNYCYTFQAPNGRFTNHGYPLGWPAGPDSDDLVLTWDLPSAWHGLTAIGIRQRRHGEGKLSDVWESEGYEAIRDKQFLTGTVEKSLGVFASASYPLGETGELNLNVGLSSIHNFRNESGENAVRPELMVEVRQHFGA